MALTEQMKQTIDDYLVTLNGTESYLKFYKGAKTRESAAVGFSRLLDRDDVKEYLREQRAKLNSPKIAKATEVSEYLTATMRGQIKGPVLINIGGGMQEVILVGPSVSDRTKAAELLGKQHGLFTDKVEVSADQKVVIVDDID